LETAARLGNPSRLAGEIEETRARLAEVVDCLVEIDRELGIERDPDLDLVSTVWGIREDDGNVVVVGSEGDSRRAFDRWGDVDLVRVTVFLDVIEPNNNST
jgi:hypothetical protein